MPAPATRRGHSAALSEILRWSRVQLRTLVLRSAQGAACTHSVRVGVTLRPSQTRDFGGLFGLLRPHELTCCPLEIGLASSMTTEKRVPLKMMAGHSERTCEFGAGPRHPDALLFAAAQRARR